MSDTNRAKNKLIWALAQLSRRVWRLKGWDRVLRTLYSPASRSQDHICCILPYDEDLLIHVDTASFIEWTIFFKTQYEMPLVRLYKRLIKPGMCVIDVGANIGCHTLIFSKLVTSDGNVVAVEPNPQIADRLEANCRLNKINNVRLFRLACASAARETGQLVKSETSNKTAHLQNDDIPSPESTSNTIINVQVSTLDDIFTQSKLERCDMIKIDVDGGEYDVLLGSVHILNTFQPYLLFEYAPMDNGRPGADLAMVQSYLERFSYRLYFIHEFRGHFSHLSLATDNAGFGNLFAVSESAL